MPPPIIPEAGEVVVVEPSVDPKPKVRVGQQVQGEAGAGTSARAASDLVDLGEQAASSVRAAAARAQLPLTRVAVRVRPRDSGGNAVDLDVILEGPLEQRERDYLMRILELYARRGGRAVRNA